MKLLVIGAGGVSFWTAFALKSTLGSEVYLTVVDDDIVEGTGAARLPASIRGRKKVDGLRMTLQMVSRQTIQDVRYERVEEATWAAS